MLWRCCIGFYHGSADWEQISDGFPPVTSSGHWAALNLSPVVLVVLSLLSFHLLKLIVNLVQPQTWLV